MRASPAPGSTILVVGLSLAFGCTAVIGDPGAEPGERGPDGETSIPSAPPPGGCRGEECLEVEEIPSPAPRFRRLTHAQWESTVRDLFRMDAAPGLASSFNSDPAIGELEEDVRRLSVTSGLWRDYQRGAEAIAEQVTADAATVARWLPSGATDASTFIRDFGLRAYRRPMTDADVARLSVLYAEGPTLFPAMDPTHASIRLVLEGMLQSPHFVYRVESSTDVAEGLVPLDDYEVASRLSYFLWGSMPDDELFAAAAGGDLSTDAGLREQASRMFRDERTSSAFRRFHTQIFELESWSDLDKSAELFPAWRPELGASMREEVQLFLSEIVFSGGDIGDFLTSTTAFVDAELAALYGVGGVTGSEMQRVELDPTERAGLLTRLGFLAKNATLTEPDPIHRGVFINLSVLCRTITAPPVIPDDLMPVGDTNRERVNSITGPGTCGEGCHGTIINPLGFGLEMYDAVGAIRPDDNGFPIDDTARYVFLDGDAIDYDGPIEMSQALAEQPEVHECYASRLIEVAQGRHVSDGDSPLVFRAGHGSLEGTMTVEDVVLELVTSRSFRTRATAELEVAE